MRNLIAGCLILVSLSALGASDWDPKPGFVYARVRYHMKNLRRFERELPWHHDYPYSDEMFTTFVKEVTTVDTTRESYKIVDIDSPDLFKYPFAYLCEPGFLDLLPEDVENLREYLDRGGFIFVDDFRGRAHLENLIWEMKKVYPDRELVRLGETHEIFRLFYEIEDPDTMVAPYGELPVEFLALLDKKGNVQMIVNYNNDLGERWEWLDRGEQPLQDAALSLKLGVDYLMYAMTH